MLGMARVSGVLEMAVGLGFEPREGYPSTVFKSSGTVLAKYLTRL